MGTPIYNLPYPTDYTGIADVPEWLKDLADATEDALDNIDLSDYYTKAETYSKTEIDNMIGNLETILETLDTGSGVV